MQVAGAQEENNVTLSPDRVGDASRSSVLSSLSNNLYTVIKLYSNFSDARF